MTQNRTKTGRLRCRQCDGLAAVSENLCTACKLATVQSHVRARGRVGANQAKNDDLQKAYSDALKSSQHKATPMQKPGTQIKHAALLGISSGTAFWSGGALSQAQIMAITLGSAPTPQAVNALFFSYSQRTFYRHMRALLRTLETSTRRYQPKSRKSPSAPHGPSIKAGSEQNIALAQALRFTRIFLQEELIPLALKLNCGQSQIWRFEKALIVIAPYWVERYAIALKLHEGCIWQFADALVGRTLQPKQMVQLFVDTVLRGDHKQAATNSAVAQAVSEAARFKLPADVRLHR